MTMRRSLLVAFLSVALGLLCVPAAQSQSGQHYVDDGYFNVYVYASAGSDGSIYATASSPEPHNDEDYTSYSVYAQPTWSLSGGNYRNSGQGSSFSAGPVPLGDTYDASFEFSIEFYYEDPSAGGEFDGGCEQYIDGQTCRGLDNLVADVSLYLPAPPPPPPNACAVSSNQAAGFTSIVPSGLSTGISGTFSVSFGGVDFAGITPPQVNYGPSSTPESIAASMAALITRNYAQYGLTAKAVGRNVIYSGTAVSGSGSATLGTVTNVFSGNGGASSSFLANTSPTAANEAETACESSPPPPTSVCGPDPGSRQQINVPAKIARARMLLSSSCKAKFTEKLKSPAYTTTKLFQTLDRANICQYPNHGPSNEYGYANTDTRFNTIDLLPDFYSVESSDDQAFTLIHEGIHLFGGGAYGGGAYGDQAVINIFDLKPQNIYDTNVFTRYIAGSCIQ